MPADAPLVAARTVDLTFAALAGWLMLGVYLDAWAHGAHLPDSFWTPWHGILYSGLVACAAFLVGASLVEGRTARRILAPGYGLSLVGAAVAGLGGIADAIWHALFGIEFDIDAAVSASHLVIVAGIFLLVSGPARAAWASRSRIGVPGALSLLYALSILTVILSYANPFAGLMGTGPAPSSAALGQLEQIRGIFAFSSDAALVSGLALLALRYGPIAPPLLALVVGGNAVAMVLDSGPRLGDALGVMLAVAVAEAIVVAALVAWLRPAPERPRELRGFAFLLPALPFAVYALVVSTVLGTWWSVTFWVGLVMLGGLVGGLMSAVVSPRTT